MVLNEHVVVNLCDNKVDLVQLFLLVTVPVPPCVKTCTKILNSQQCPRQAPPSNHFLLNVCEQRQVDLATAVADFRIL